MERRASLCETVLDIGANDPDQVSIPIKFTRFMILTTILQHVFAKSGLSKLLNDVPLVVQLITTLQPYIQNGPPATKRARLARFV